MHGLDVSLCVLVYRCIFWSLLLIIILWCITALKYFSLPACMAPSVEQCLAHYSLSRPVYPLRTTTSELINHSEYRSWGRVQTSGGLCCRMIAGDRCAVEDVNYTSRHGDDDSIIYAQFNSCASIQAELYNNYYVSQEELSFPLAYIALVHKEPHMLLRFLNAVYRRHNVYCIHYDHKAAPRFKSFIRLLSKCVDNVIIPEKIEDVTWGDASILNAQLNCFRALMAYHTVVPWKYAFNLQGHELPLRTNRELVEMLQSQPHNMSIAETWPIVDNIDRNRLTYQIRTIHPFGNIKVVLQSSAELTPLLPSLELDIFKSWCFIAATPHFVHYMLESNVSRVLANFLQNVASAEEYFYASLYNYRLTPGGRYHGLKMTESGVPYEPPFAVSASMWLHGVTDRHKYCHGRNYHVYCQFSVRDLKTIFSLYVNGELIEPFPINNFGYGNCPNFTGGTKKTMFLNKYMTDTSPDAMDCLEERLSMQNILEYYFDQKHH